MKVYTSKKEIGTGYFEMNFHEYMAGQIYRTGTEDFSLERLPSLKRYEIWTPNGGTDKGGRNTYDCREFIWTDDIKAAKIYAADHYGAAQLRRC